tara:strand:- start:319 stop:618 length:300 start_codon:yes stop_codon:yes gene_type:complete
MIEEEYDYRDHHVVVEIELMEDNQKIWYFVTCPDGEERTVDVSPYGNQNELVKKWIEIFMKFGEYPERVGVGPLTMHDLCLIEMGYDAEAAQKSPRDFK